MEVPEGQVTQWVARYANWDFECAAAVIAFIHEVDVGIGEPLLSLEVFRRVLMKGEGIPALIMKAKKECKADPALVIQREKKVELDEDIRAAQKELGAIRKQRAKQAVKRRAESGAEGIRMSARVARRGILERTPETKEADGEKKDAEVETPVQGLQETGRGAEEDGLEAEDGEVARAKKEVST
jgi:hypothetical protein